MGARPMPAEPGRSDAETGAIACRAPAPSGATLRIIFAIRSLARADSASEDCVRATGIKVFGGDAGKNARLILPLRLSATCRVTVMLRASTRPSTYAVHSPWGG